MNRPTGSTQRLYLPHADGTLTSSPALANGHLPVLTDLTRAKDFLTSYLETHPADVLAHPPAGPLAVCEVDATATLTPQGRLTFPVDRDLALTQPHRQVVTVGPLQRPHPRALAVAHTVASSQADTALRPKVDDPPDPRGEAAVIRASNAVQTAWRHGHDVAYANSWRALAGAAQRMGHRLTASGPSGRTPAPPPRLLTAAASFAGSDQIVEVIEQAWRSGLALGGGRGTYADAAALATGGRPGGAGIGGRHHHRRVDQPPPGAAGQRAGWPWPRPATPAGGGAVPVGHLPGRVAALGRRGPADHPAHPAGQAGATGPSCAATCDRHQPAARADAMTTGTPCVPGRPAHSRHWRGDQR